MVLDFVTGAQVGQMVKVGKSHCGVTLDPENNDECDPGDPGEPKVKIWKVDKSKPAMQRLDAIESEGFCKNAFTSQAFRWGLHLGCALVLTDDWGMNEEKHATAMKQLRDTIRPKLMVTNPGVRDKSDLQYWLRTICKTWNLRRVFRMDLGVCK